MSEPSGARRGRLLRRSRPVDCSHFAGATFKEAGDVVGCEECLKIGGEWVHLRRCMVCGKVGCCNDSPNTHAAKHYAETGHAVMRSVEPGESWGYCYVDDIGIADAGSIG